MIIVTIVVMRRGVITINKIIFIQVTPTFGVKVRWLGLITGCRMLLLLLGLVRVNQLGLMYIIVIGLGSEMEGS